MNPNGRIRYGSSPLLASPTPVWRSKFIVASIAFGFVLLAVCMLEALLLSGALLTTRAALILTTIFGLSTRNSHAPLANLYSCAHRPLLHQPPRSRCSRVISIRVRGLGNPATTCAH